MKSKPSEENFIEVIEQFEKSIGQTEIKYRGFGIWSLLKPILTRSILSQAHQNLNLNHQTKVRKWMVGSKFFGLWNLFGRYEYIFLTSSRSKVRIEGKYVDQHCDPIARELGDKCLTVERPYPFHYPRSSCENKNVVTISFVSILMKIFGFLYRKPVSFEGQSDLLKVIKEFDLNVDIAKEFRGLFLEYLAYRTFFKIYRPKEIFLVLRGYSFSPVWAAHSLGIKVNEISHGLLYPEHPSYNSICKIDRQMIPDRYWSVGGTAKVIESTRSYYSPESLISINSFYMDYLQKKGIAKEFQRYRQGFEKTVVVTLQNSNEELLLPVIREAAKRLPNVLFVLGIRSSKPSYDELGFTKNVVRSDVVFSSLNIYEMLVSSDLHITISSTCSIEATYLQRPTILLNLKDLSDPIIKNFYSDSLMCVAQSVDDVISQIRSLSNEANVKTDRVSGKDQIQNAIREVGLA